MSLLFSKLRFLGSKKASYWISIACLVLISMVWIKTWNSDRPVFKGDWSKDIKVAMDIKNGTVTHYSSSWRYRGFPLFILFSSKLFGREPSESVLNLMFYVWGIAFCSTWFGVRSKTDTTVANMVVAFLILYLFHEKYYSISLLIEPLYCSILLIVFSLLLLYNNNRGLAFVFLLGALVSYAHEVRPIPTYGIAIPFMAYLIKRIIVEKEKKKKKEIISFCIGIVVPKIVVIITIGFFYNFAIPDRSLAFPTTARILNMDGICRKTNGPASQKLLSIEKEIAMQKRRHHREGSIFEDEDTYLTAINKYGIKTTEDIYYKAAFESIKAYPLIVLRNTFLNLASFLLNYDLLFVEARRKSNLQDFPINPVEWKKENIIKMANSILFEILEKPFWVLLIIILLLVRHNNSYNPFMIIFMVFCLTSILLPSLFSRYVYRYNWPIFVTSFLPIGIILGQLFSYAWPLLITSSVRTSILISYLLAKAIAWKANSEIAPNEDQFFYFITIITEWKVILTLFLVFYFVCLWYGVGKIQTETNANLLPSSEGMGIFRKKS